LSLNSYIVLDAEGYPIGNDTPRKKHICDTLTAKLRTPEKHTSPTRKRIPRRLKQFTRPTEVEIDAAAPPAGATAYPGTAYYAAINIIASDRPGLLARIGMIFLELDLAVHNARITTLGELVEDTFFVTESDGKSISDPKRIADLEREIGARLDQSIDAQVNVL
jgi:[protein-PII] uridylyltransferase